MSANGGQAGQAPSTGQSLRHGQPPKDTTTAAPNTRQEEEESCRDCVVCQSAAVSIVLLPCRHACVCDSCVAHFQYCPICRALILESFTLTGNQQPSWHYITQQHCFRRGGGGWGCEGLGHQPGVSHVSDVQYRWSNRRFLSFHTVAHSLLFPPSRVLIPGWTGNVLCRRDHKLLTYTFLTSQSQRCGDIKVGNFNFGTINLNMGIHQANTQKRITVEICLIKENLHRFIIQLRLQFLWIGHFPHSLHEIFLGDVLAVRADGKQTCTKRQDGGSPDEMCSCQRVTRLKRQRDPTCFCAHVSQVRSIKTIWQLHDGFKI